MHLYDGSYLYVLKLISCDLIMLIQSGVLDHVGYVYENSMVTSHHPDPAFKCHDSPLLEFNCHP